MNFSKRACFERAKALLEKDSDDSLRYACLELRGCMEALAYEYLKLNEKRVPEHVLETWQPKKVMEVLSEYDPHVDKDFTLRIYSEDSDGNPESLVFSQAHKALDIRFLRKHYNKIGSYLHCPTPAQVKKSKGKVNDNLKNYIAQLTDEIKQYVENSFHSNIAETVSFECAKCGEVVIRNTRGLKDREAVKCFNAQCGALHSWEKQGEQYIFRLCQTEWKCPECATTQYVSVHELEEGKLMSCVECSCQFVLGRRWVFGIQT